MAFSFSSSIPQMIDTLNDVVYVNGNKSNDAVNELSALVYANNIINSDGDDKDFIPFYTKMFFKHYDALEWRSDFIQMVCNRINFLISSPNN